MRDTWPLVNSQVRARPPGAEQLLPALFHSRCRSFLILREWDLVKYKLFSETALENIVCVEAAGSDKTTMQGSKMALI